MSQRKKLIEVALPLEAINAASAREKSIRHGHPSTLHLWWARRPLAAARAVIFTSLVDDPDDPNAPAAFVAACKALTKGKNATASDTPRQRLFDFIEQLVTWEATTDEKILNKARELIRLSTNGNPPPLLDPFAGGGSIPLEAQRLGLEAHASDLNPVAVMINKALIEIPPQFANQAPVNPRDRAKVGSDDGWRDAAGLAADVSYYGEWMRDEVWKRVKEFFPKHNNETVLAWLWTRTVTCPNPACAANMPLVKSFKISNKKNLNTWIEPKVEEKSRKIKFSIKQGKKSKAPKGTILRKGGVCIVCGTPAPLNYIREQGLANKMTSELLAIITEGKNGKNYYPPDQAQKEISEKATPLWKPNFQLNHNPRDIRPQLYGLETYADIFTNRQLTVLSNFCDVINDVRLKIVADSNKAKTNFSDKSSNNKLAFKYADAICVYLAFCIDKATDYWSTLATWMPRGTVGHVFSRHALPITWDYPEANPFSNFHCSWDELLGWVQKSILTLPASQKMGNAIQQDATLLSNDRGIPISTDPPYYDNIAYADIADYFYVWMRASLKDIYPELFSTLLVPKMPELVASSHRFQGDENKANHHFESGLLKAFDKMRQIIPDQYPLTIYYAFKQEEKSEEEKVSSTGWETMLSGLINANFSIIGTWPVRTERSVRSIGQGSNALASSIVLVCRPRPENVSSTTRRDFVNSLRRELPTALQEMTTANIAPVDLAQASIGPGMGVYSRYAKVLEANGDPLTVRTALQLINQVLDEYLAETEGDLDGDSRFAVAWFQQYGFNSGDFGTADVLARAKNTSVSGLSNAGLLEAEAGKVRLLTWQELDPGWQPEEDDRLTIWEATHHLIERLNVHGETGAAMLLAKLSPTLASEARQLAYRLYSICERKGWTDHARDYNALVISWNASQEQAANFKETPTQGRLFD